jgi:hypothetical protein
MEWISFFEQQPEDEQHIWYYGKHIGVWRGEYRYSPDDVISPHIMVCHESFGFVDRMDAPWWMPNDGNMQRPTKPAKDYPEDYPHG